MNNRRFPLALTTLSSLVVLFLSPYLAERAFYAHAQDKRTPPQRTGIQSLPQVFGNTSLSDPQITLFIGADGRFTMQTADGRWILYPYNDDRNPFSTFLTIRIDEKDFSNANGTLTVNRPLQIDSGNNSGTIGYAPHPDISITQHFEIVGRATKLTLQIKNNGRTSHDVKARYLLDTQIDANDGAPLYASGASVQTFETDLPSPSFNKFFAYDVWPAPTLISQGTFDTTPTRIVFAHWPKAKDTLYSYSPDPNQRFFTPGFTKSPESDSCVLVYYALGTLAPGGSKEIVLYYGTGAPIIPPTPRQQVIEALNELERAMKDSLDNNAEIMASLLTKIIKKVSTFRNDFIIDGLQILAEAASGTAVDNYLATQAGQTFIQKYGESGGQHFVEALMKHFKDKASDPKLYFRLAETTLGRWLAANVNGLGGDPESSIKAYLRTELPIQVSETQVVTGIDGLKEHLTNIFATTRAGLPDQLPPNYPLTTVVSSLKRLASDYVKSKNGEVQSGFYSDTACHFFTIGTIPKARGPIEATTTLADVNKKIKIATIVGLLGGAAVKGAIALTGVGLAAQPVIQSVYVPFATSAAPIILRTTSYSGIALKFGMILQMTELQTALAGELDAGIIVAEATQRYVLSNLRLPITEAQLAAEPNLKISEAVFADLIFGPDEFAKQTTARITLSNLGETTVAAQPGVSIYVNTIDGPLLIGGGAADRLQVPAKSTTTTTLSVWAMRPDSFGSQTYIANIFLTVGQVFIGPRVAVFKGYAQGAGQTPVLTSELAVGKMNTGEKNTVKSHVSTPHIDYVLAHFGGDLDLHIRDAQGRHVGINYQTGLVEVQIPGAFYSGPLSNPETISLVLPSSPQGDVSAEIVGLDGEGIQYSLSEAEGNRPQPTLSLAPQSFGFEVTTSANASTTFTMQEVSGQEGVNNVEVKLSGFANEQGQILSPSSMSIGSPPLSIASRASGNINLSVNIPANSVSGRYTGFLQATGVSALTQSNLAASVPISITVINQEYEADVAPRPNGNGNGKVTMVDWVQVGNFFIRKDVPALGSEFQRADCAPKATKGDGLISIADWVQAGRYAAGLDPVVPAGGPTTPSYSLMSSFGKFLEGSSQRVHVANTQLQRGQIGTLNLELDAQGNENALAFTLNFDPKALNFLDASLGDGAKNAALSINNAQAAQGRLGVALALSTGQAFAAGNRVLLQLRFVPLSGEGTTRTSISFDDQILRREIVDAEANALSSTSFSNATVEVVGRSAAHVIAANYWGPEVAAESIASAFGMELATTTMGAAAGTLPTTLGGTRVLVKDVQGVERWARLFFVSPNQVNYELPTGMAEGYATVTITNARGTSTAGLVNVSKVAPGIFSADASGKGLAAGSVLYVRANNARQEMPLARFDAGSNKLVALPIDLSERSGQAYLTLYGTGLRNRTDIANVKAKIGGVDVPIEYAGAQGNYAGLDQINLKLPRELSGRGEVDVEITVDGKLANPVRVTMR